MCDLHKLLGEESRSICSAVVENVFRCASGMRLMAISLNLQRQVSQMTSGSHVENTFRVWHSSSEFYQVLLSIHSMTPDFSNSTSTAWFGSLPSCLCSLSPPFTQFSLAPPIIVQPPWAGSLCWVGPEGCSDKQEWWVPSHMECTVWNDARAQLLSLSTHPSHSNQGGGLFLAPFLPAPWDLQLGLFLTQLPSSGCRGRD